MTTRNAALALVSALVVSGCASVQPAKSLRVERVSERNYEIGVEKSATVGEAMLRARLYAAVHDDSRMTFNQTCTLRVSLGADPTFVHGISYPVIGEAECGDARCRTVSLGRAVGGQDTAIRIDAAGKPVGNVLNPSLGIVTLMPAAFEPPTCAMVAATASVKAIDDEPYENFEIIYSGMDGQSMRFIYREYTLDNLARPAFTQDFSYPADTPNVRFKKLSIDVIEAHAHSISFVVRAD